MRKICCFAGHSKFYDGEEIRKQIYDKARELVSDVNQSFGGAAKTLEYAKRKKHIEIFNFGEL